RVVRLDLQHDKGGAVALAQHAAALGEFGFAGDRAGALDAGAGGDLFEVDAEAGVALLVTGLAVMAVIDAEDREIGRVQHRDRRRHVDALRVVIRHYRIPQNDLAPSKFWVSSTATARPP